MNELADLYIWDLFALLRNPLGSAATPLPSGEFTTATTGPEVRATQEAARAEFRARDFSDDEIAVMEEGDDSPIRKRRYNTD